MLVLGGACDDGRAPTSPTGGQAVIALENVVASATKRVAVLTEPFSYQVSLSLRETGGTSATISQVTTILSEASGATTENQLSATEAFGTTRIAANGTLADWSRIRVVLMQSGDALTGGLITRDGRRFPVSGCVSCEWAPSLAIGGLGWIEAAWAPSENNRRAKYYKLTAAGRKALKTETAQWQRLSTAISLVVKPS